MNEDIEECDICGEKMELNRSFTLPCWECGNTECPNYTRSDIYQLSLVVDAIQREQNFQRQKWGDKPLSLEGYLLIIEGELEEAKQAWRKSKGNDDCLRELLQVATVCIRALESHSVVEREEIVSK